MLTTFYSEYGLDYIPTRATKNDSCLDCRARGDYSIPVGSFAKVNLGFRVRLADHSGIELQIRGRSGLASKGILAHVGTVDYGYTGEVAVILFNLSGKPFEIRDGDRVCQARLQDTSTDIEDCVILGELHESMQYQEDRGGGFGSTGNR